MSTTTRCTPGVRQAAKCLRASPLTKHYGFGAHYDADGRIALHPREQPSYARLSDDPTLRQLRAMRSAPR